MTNNNKFLELYPQLWTPKIGDWVCLTTEQPEVSLYSIDNKIGDIGKIIQIDTVEPRFLVRKNDGQTYLAHQGTYWVYSNTFKLISLNENE
jgi:hypothetical protein